MVGLRGVSRRINRGIAPVSVLTTVPRQVEEIFSPSSITVTRIILGSSAAAAQTRPRDDRLVSKMIDTTRGKTSDGE